MIRRIRFVLWLFWTWPGRQVDQHIDRALSVSPEKPERWWL